MEGVGDVFPPPSSRVRAIRGKNGCRDGFLREGDDAGRAGLMRFEGKGNHKGCLYGGRMWWWSSNGLVSMGGGFPNHPYGAK